MQLPITRNWVYNSVPPPTTELLVPHNIALFAYLSWACIFIKSVRYIFPNHQSPLLDIRSLPAYKHSYISFVLNNCKTLSSFWKMQIIESSENLE